MSRIDDALNLVAAGFYVFPLKDPGAIDRDGNPAGKSPRITGWQQKSTIDPAQIKAWWSKWPNANIGIDTGKTCLLVVDIDPEHGGTVEALNLTQTELNTVTQITGGGGIHLFYRQSGGFGNSANRLGQGIDTRGQGGYIVAPGSIHPNTRQPYRWADGKSPAEVPILDLPVSLAAKLKIKKEIAVETPRTTATLGDNRPYVQAALQRELDTLSRAANGTRNNELNRAAFNLGQFVGAGALNEIDVRNALEHTALAIGLGEIEAAKTIASGLAKGKLKPRRIPESRHSRRGDARDRQQTVTGEPVKTDLLDMLAAEKPPKPTDDVLRDRWIKTAGRVVCGLGEWLRYRGGIWHVVKPAIIKREMTRILEAAKKEGITPTANRLNSVSELAKNELTVGDDSIFDANPNYLVCANGALHIPTRTLKPHNPELYATSGLSFDYSPTAIAPHWGQFLGDLERIIGKEVLEFLQEFAGYALTTDTRHEVAIWLYGPPGGGKSTFITGLQTMLGKRAGLLGLATIERSQFALGNLPGKTLMLATEQPAMFIKCTDVLNAVISGEPITVEKKFKDPIEIIPRAKLLWAMNELPRVAEAGNGLFRQVKVVEFPTIPEGRKDPTLKEGIKQEGAGILNWALIGLERLNRRGRFVIPNSVQAATNDFQSQNDIPAAFVQECCVTGLDANGNPYRTQTSRLYNAYKQWCLENGHKPQSATNIAGDWKRLRFRKDRPGGVVYWFGVGLKV